MWLLHRKFRLKMMVKQWEKFENTQKLGQNREISTIPKRLKENLVKELLRTKEKQFMQVRKQWKMQCEELRQRRRLLIEDNPLVTLPELQLPPAPAFVGLLKQEDLAGLVASAEKKKVRWDRLGKGRRP